MEVETEGIFWPDGVEREETIDAFVAALRTEGYRLCEPLEDGPGVIEGFEKIAIYVDLNGVPSHVAKQTKNGKWTSKLGAWEDIDHAALDDLACSADGQPGYGKPVK